MVSLHKYPLCKHFIVSLSKTGFSGRCVDLISKSVWNCIGFGRKLCRVQVYSNAAQPHRIFNGFGTERNKCECLDQSLVPFFTLLLYNTIYWWFIVCEIDFNRFCKLRRACKILAAKCHNEYKSKIEHSIQPNIKSFWSHVDSLRNNTAITPIMILGAWQAADAPGTVFSDATVPISEFDFSWNDTVPQCAISATDLQSKLSSLDPNKGAGPDDIPAARASILASHLASADGWCFPVMS